MFLQRFFGQVSSNAPAPKFKNAQCLNLKLKEAIVVEMDHRFSHAKSGARVLLEDA